MSLGEPPRVPSFDFGYPGLTCVQALMALEGRERRIDGEEAPLLTCGQARRVFADPTNISGLRCRQARLASRYVTGRALWDDPVASWGDYRWDWKGTPLVIVPGP